MSSGSILTPDRQNISTAADCIRNGGIVAYPTETVYGLGVDPFDDRALQRLFALKERPPEHPVLLLIHSRSEIEQLVTHIPSIASDLMDRFWPGPLTLILPARENLSSYVTSAAGTVAIRQASQGTAADLLVATRGPITSTSANRGGQTPATTAQEAAEFVTGENDIVLDGYCEPDALPSTLVDTTGEVPTILRPGAIPRSDILG